jgi:hypothetical protein
MPAHSVALPAMTLPLNTNPEVTAGTGKTRTNQIKNADFIRIRKPDPLAQSFMIPLRGSEDFGYAVNQGRGMMEYWGAGMLGLVE